jgi:formate hydrogenlyase transcriptional activator
VQEFNKKMGKSVDAVSSQTMERLKQYPWPGNVRELRNLIERAMIVTIGRSLTIDLPAVTAGPSPVPETLEEVERKHIRDVLERVHWRISGKQGAAGILGLRPTTLHSRMKKLGIPRPRP